MPNRAKPSTEPRPWPKLLTVAEVAKILRASDSTVHRLCQTGELVSLRISGRRMVARSDLWAYLRRLRRESIVSAQTAPTPSDDAEDAASENELKALNTLQEALAANK